MSNKLNILYISMIILLLLGSKVDQMSFSSLVLWFFKCGWHMDYHQPLYMSHSPSEDASLVWKWSLAWNVKLTKKQHFFFLDSRKPHFPKSVFCGPRWASKIPTVPCSYKRCTPWLKLETCCADLKLFVITLRPLGTLMGSSHYSRPGKWDLFDCPGHQQQRFDLRIL
jgi:hypothetical protein